MNQTVKDGKPAAIAAYLLLIGTLIAWSINQDKQNKFASFHIRQAIGLDILFVICGLVISYSNSWFLTFPFWLLFTALWIFAISGAIQGKLSFIPLFGKHFQKWFKSLA